MLKVSLITTVYNTKTSYLKDLIDSVKNQTYNVYEHIIVDDGSTSNDTLNFLKEYEKEPNVKIFYMEENKGIGYCRNYGIDNSLGDYICFLDSDDWLDSKIIEKYIECANEYLPDMVLSLGYVIYNDEKKEMGYSPTCAYDDVMYSRFSLPTGARFFRRDFIIRNKVYFPNRQLYEDNVFFVLAACKANEIRSIGYYGYCNRINEGSFSHSDRYRKATIEQIPYEGFAKIVYEIQELSGQAKIQAIGQIEVMVSTCSIFFCRETNLKEKYKVLKKNREILLNINAPLLKILKETMLKDINIDNKIKNAIRLYMISVVIRLDILYCIVVHLMIRIVAN